MPLQIRGQKYLWQMADFDTQQVLALAGKYNFSIPIAQALISRGLSAPDVLEPFLFGSMENSVGNASLLKDAEKAIQRILSAIDRQEKILIFGDYDVDGITASALMMLCLKPLTPHVNFFLPHRTKDGYGISAEIVERAAKNGYSLIVTVDNGITAFSAAQKAKELAIDLIITDHHRPHDAVPESYAIINPHQDDCPYPYKKFAGVGVIFKVMSLLYERIGKKMPEKAIELLLFGTIADVVPLTGENRFWVRYGLQQINRSESYALKVLKKNGNVIKEKISALDIGYGLTPQINALGRLQDPRQGVKFLIGDDEREVDLVGKTLFELNRARKDIEKSILAEITTAIDSKEINLEKENIIFAASDQWPPGVIGLVASRLVAAYGKPVLLFHLTSNGMAKGSSRSIASFNMFNALQACGNLLTTFGGHSVAAGLSLSQANLAALKEQLEILIAQQIRPEDLEQKITLDGAIHLPDVTKKIMIDLDYLEPFGNENPQPIFYLSGVSLVQKPLLMKDLHVKCLIFADGVIKPVVFFNRPELFSLFIAQDDNHFDMAVQITENYWNGKVNIELLGIDVAFTNK